DFTPPVQSNPLRNRCAPGRKRPCRCRSQPNEPESRQKRCFMWWSEIRTAWRLPGMALLALLVCRAEVGAQIGKVDCHDKEYPPWTPFWKGWWHQLSTFQAPSIPRHPCYRPYCNLKAPIENFGYTHQQWRVWPGTQPNYTPKNLKVGGESMPPAET